MSSLERHPLVSYQPLRLIFQLSYAAVAISCIPYHAAMAMIPSWRPDPRWSAKQTFMTRLVYSVLDATSRVGITETLTLKQGKEGERFQTVSPSTLDVYKGPLISKIKPATIGGTWFPQAPGLDVVSKIVVLYFHGGAFIAGDGRDAQCGSIAEKLLAKGGADAVFSLQYRLSGYGGMNPFPAALQDALSSYLFLLNELRIPACQIVLGGDSAGGNLAMALVRYLEEYGATIDIPLPKCAVLLSPWVAPFKYDMRRNPHRGTDFIPSSYPAWGAHTYASARPNGASDPYITQLGNPFPTTVPILANVGTAELLLEDIIQWADEMRKVDGNVVELHLEEAAVHDTFLSGEILGFSESAWDVAAKIGGFVRKL
ncbi:alpha/beta hydrolase fold-3 domain-containing protein [Hypomontagnella monticulosa]|nr:alpha/beta hydrolase fold-3 domain-containing protein [Hypomontagnella monticulosa]